MVFFTRTPEHSFSRLGDAGCPTDESLRFRYSLLVHSGRGLAVSAPRLELHLPTHALAMARPAPGFRPGPCPDFVPVVSPVICSQRKRPCVTSATENLTLRG